MADVIVIAVVLGISALAVLYIVKTKKRGGQCIGCPEVGCDGCRCIKKDTES